MIFLKNQWLLTSLLFLTELTASTGEDRYITKTTTSGHEYENLSTVIEKPQHDSREYAGIELANKLRVILVSDKSTKISSAALNINIGSMDEPDKLPGLAHLLEHLLFVGTKKYKEERGFDAFIKKITGSSNAETLSDRTTYYYEMANEGFDESLDRFSQFFISPLLSQTGIDTEINAVESEFHYRTASDLKRSTYVQAAESNPKHPFNRFSAGNYKSLVEEPTSKGISTKRELKFFFREKYSANLMNLVVVSNLSIEEIKELVVPKFSKINNLEIPAPVHSGPVLNKKEKASLIKVVSSSQGKYLQVRFELPAQVDDYKCVPIDVIGAYLGNKGKISLLSLLKKKRLANDIFPLTQNNFNGFGILEVVMELTDLGEKNLKKIYKYLFQSLRVFKLQGITEDNVMRLKELGDLKFKFSEEKNGSEFAKEIVLLMQHLTPLSKTLREKKYPLIFNKESIKKAMSYITPRNMQVTVLSISNSQLPKLKVEPWTGAKYSSQVIGEKVIRSLEKNLNSNDAHPSSGLTLPSPSRFFPTKIKRVKSDYGTGHPKKIYESKKSILWHTLGKYKGLKSNINIMLCTKDVNESVESSAQTTVITLILMDRLTEIVYKGENSDIKTDITVEGCGIVITVTGFSQHIELFVSDIFKKTRNLKMDDQILAKTIEKSRFIFSLIHYGKLYNQGEEYVKRALTTPSWDSIACVKALEKITLKGISNFFFEFLKSLSFEMLSVGNIKPKQSIDMIKSIEKIFDSDSVSKPTFSKNTPLPKGKSWIHNVLLQGTNTNQSGTFYFLETNYVYDYKKEAYTALIGDNISSFANEQLRQKMNLGYDVSAEYRKVGTQSGISVFVQSDRVPELINQGIETMLTKFYELVSSIDNDNFISTKNALINSIKKKVRKIEDLGDYYWDFILDQSYEFNYEDNLLLALEKTSLKKFQKHINRYLLNPDSRRKFSVNFFSSKTEFNKKIDKEFGFIIKDIDSWKDKLLSK